jgi:hypothetical protein
VPSDGKESNIIGFGTTESKLGKTSPYWACIRASNYDNAFQGKKSTFPTDEILWYDLEISYDLDNLIGKESKRLKRAWSIEWKEYSSLWGPQPIRTEVQLPSFFIRGRRNSPLNLLHGSFRKLHGKGEDCLRLGDDMIRNSLTDLTRRPSVPFLIGGQIFAEDVADVLIKNLTRFGTKLVGYEESINGSERKLADIPIGDRQRLVALMHKGHGSWSTCESKLKEGESYSIYDSRLDKN